MENKLVESILSVCSTLNKHAVEYLIVGGTAVALHGYFRRSINIAGVLTDKPDLDFWYNPTYDNYYRLLNALEELGQSVKEFRDEQTPEPRNSFFRYEFERFSLDLLPALKAPLNFRSSFEKREVVDINSVNIPFIGYEDLILDKQTESRPKDIADINQLEKNRKSSGK